MSEEMLVTYCAPTLAGMKTGSLFSYKYEDRKSLNEQIRSLNKRMVPKGVCLIPIYVGEGRVLIYLYRPEKLKEDVSGKKSLKILNEMGYPDGDSNRCLARLAKKLRQSETFPHEIGLFLGYPPEDVEGFITHGSKNALCSGFWKVYSDVEGAEKTFEQYRRCNKIYSASFKAGKSLDDLTVKC